MSTLLSSKHISRFHESYIPVPESGCWLWLKSVDSGGYANFSIMATTIRGHRFAYELFKGPIPHGLQPDHLCRVRCCVNPDHLEAVTSKVNTLRGISPSAVQAKKTHCLQGHPFDKVKGRRHERYCSICNKAKCKAQRAAMKVQL